MISGYDHDYDYVCMYVCMHVCKCVLGCHMYFTTRTRPLHTAPDGGGGGARQHRSGEEDPKDT